MNMLIRESYAGIIKFELRKVLINFMAGVALFLMLMLLTALNSQAYAASCASAAGNYTFSATQSWQRDTAVGYVGAKIGAQGGAVWNMSCTGDASADRDVYFTMKVNGSPVSGYTDVYSTNIQGVGVRYNFALNTGSLTFCAIQYDDHINNSSRQYTCHLPKNTSQSFSLGASLQFVKLSNDINSGVINSIPAVTASYSLNNQSGTWELNNIWTGAGNLNLSVLACSINNSNMVFPIGDVQVASFGSQIGTVVDNAQNTQNLALNCGAGSNINISLNGIQNPDVSTTSVLALTGQGNADVAKGVGVQLLYNGTPLVLNNRIVLKQSAGGQETFPITARYYQTKTSVLPGKANTAATLDLTYQ